MTTHPPLHRLRRRYLIASATVLLASVVEFALSQFPAPVFYLAAVPIVVVVACTVVLTRTAAVMERASNTANNQRGALVDKQTKTSAATSRNID